MSNFLNDLGHAARQLFKRPAFTLITIVTLALGIGATTAIFSVVDHVVLRPLPYDNADRVVTLWETDVAKGEMHKEVSPGNFLAWQERTTAFEALGLAEPTGVDLTVNGSPESVPTWSVTQDYFQALGVRPILGAGFEAAHFQPGGPDAVVISYAAWQARFNGDPQVIGRTLEMNDVAVAVVGVLPPWVEYPEPKEFWFPKRFRQSEPGDRVSSYMHAVGRLAENATLREAQAELDTVASALAAEFPRSNGDAGIRLLALEDEIVAAVRPAMMVLLCAVALMLLIACANAAHLLLVRAAERTHELSLRSSLGASRTRLAQQLLAECLLLAVLGGVAGICIGSAGLKLIVALSPPELPRMAEVAVDGRVFAFAALTTLFTVLIIGLAPVLRLSHVNMRAALSSGRRTQTADRSAIRLRSGLIVAETVFAIILLVGAGLLARSFYELISEKPGFDIDGRSTLQAFIWDRNPTAADRIQRVAAFDAEFEAMPGIESAAVVSALPFHPTRIEQRRRVNAAGAEGMDSAAEAVVLSASRDYFQTMGIPLRRGQVFANATAQDAPAGAVINEALAKAVFSGTDPIGRQLVMTSSNGTSATVEITGVIGDVKPTAYDSQPDPEMYLPFESFPTGGVTFVTRAHEGVDASLAAMRQAFWRVDPGQSIYHAATMEELVSDTLVQRRFLLLLNGVFSIVALVLVAIGIFGVISYSSRQRVGEIGIRMALGAKGQDVLAMILRQSMLLAFSGVALGLLIAAALSSFLSPMLYGVTATDAVTYTGVAILVLLVTMAASWFPAQRATGITPVEALRYE